MIPTYCFQPIDLHRFTDHRNKLATELLELFKPLKLAAAVIESVTPEMLAHSR